MRVLLASLTLTLSLTTAVANAQTVYKFVDKNGNLVFSDTPVSGAEAIDVQPASTVTMTPVKLPDAPAPTPVAPKGYQSVAITTPSQDAVFSNDPEPVLITGSSKPDLQPGHKYRFVINGQATRTLPSASFSLTGPDRGAYTVVLEIVDSNLHAVAQSQPVTFHVRHHSKLFKKPTAPGPMVR